jgi:UDP-N-acetylmuramoyl-L-alanyl-D-glutamate--2,6-diaminopimelate ligase
MPSLTLSQLTENTQARVMKGAAGTLISGVSHDSRAVAPGDLFVCLVGERFDGHAFIEDAFSQRAGAVMGSDDEALSLSPGPAVFSPDPRSDMALMSHKLWGHPSRNLKLVGVTGTNGKSTTTHLLESIFSASGISPGIIGTLGARVAGRQRKVSHTTPESCDIARLLADMVAEGVGAVAMEVSSHGIAQDRPKGCEFDVGVFCNLTQDHLDYHGDLESYYQTKRRLFAELPALSGKAFRAAVNSDDPFGQRLAGESLGEVVTFGTDGADVRAESVSPGAGGIGFALKTPWGDIDVQSNLLGRYNVLNCLAAAAAAGLLGIELSAIACGIADLKRVPGRLEPVERGQPFHVLVDYAHTPSALQSALGAAREIALGRVIAVFGCGGDRDRGKRPIMGRICAENSDLCVITSDNPRSEEPQAIIDEIMTGIDGSLQSEVARIPDRAEAIDFAVAAAGPDDVVLIAGKGHEDYQIFRDETIHFDDREVAADAVERWLSSAPKT